MRVLLVSCLDPLAEIVCRRLPGSERAQLAGIVRTKFTWDARSRILKAALRENSLYYTAYMAVEAALPRLVYREMPEPLLERVGQIPYKETTSVNSLDTIRFVEGLSADLVLSIRPGHIFRGPFIDAVPPIVNLHCSMLPDYRGIGAVLQALAAGERELGISYHFIEDQGVDSGPILTQARLPVRDSESLFAQTLRLYVAAADVLDTALENFANRAQPRPQESGSYYSWPGPAPRRRLRSRGRNLLDVRDLWTRQPTRYRSGRG